MLKQFFIAIIYNLIFETKFNEERLLQLLRFYIKTSAPQIGIKWSSLYENPGGEKIKLRLNL